MENKSKKEIKRKSIATSCCDIFTKNGFHNISISQIALTAGIGKGTIYEYFKNKEDIVFELMSCLQENYDEEFQHNLKVAITPYDKILTLFSIFISKNENIKVQRAIYKQFLIICLTQPSDEIKVYNTNLRKKYIIILDEIIENINLSTKIYDSVVGFFVASNSLVTYDLETTIKDFIKNELDNKEG
ncbi:MAG: TetR/AcrR family transcriptional regulator [Arcobacteraceae bacterium]|nr:TetR/AcrR family transcriptional regulator [Arcobacteraceae bacterium]